MTTINAIDSSFPISIASGGTAATTASGARTNLGLGTIATQNASSVAITGGAISGVSIQSYTEINVTANTGASYTINLASANVFILTLTANCTFAFSNVPASNTSSITLQLIQDGTGSRTVTWPGSVTWLGGVAPTLKTAAGAVDIITMLTSDGGTTWYSGIDSGGTAGGYATVDNNGTPLTQRSVLNFADTGLVATDNSGTSATDITLASGINGWSGYNTSGILTQTAINTYTGRTLTGTANRLTITNGSGVAGNPTFDISASYVGQSSITTLGTIGTGTWNGSVIGATYGGTGVNNGASTITLGGNLTTSGAFATTLTTTATTNVTLPTSGTLCTDAGSTNIVTVGTITTGTWQGTLVAGQYGGTGVNNSGKTITLGGNLTTSGAFATTLTVTGATTVTLPTTGTLVNTAVTTLSSLVSIGTITTGTWNGTVVSGTYGGTGVNNGASTITIGGNVTVSGAFTTTLTVTGATSVTLPTSGTLVNTGVTSLSSLATVGTITSGTWSSNLQTYTETNNASSQAAAYAINLNNGNVHSLTLTGNVTLSFSNVPASNATSVTLFLIQDGTGSRTVTWPGSVIWPGGTAPTLTTVANHVDQIVMITTNAGTTWRAASILNYSS